jgi:hypothetical protein
VQCTSFKGVLIVSPIGLLHPTTSPSSILPSDLTQPWRETQITLTSKTMTWRLQLWPNQRLASNVEMETHERFTQTVLPKHLLSCTLFMSSQWISADNSGNPQVAEIGPQEHALGPGQINWILQQKDPNQCVWLRHYIKER